MIRSIETAEDPEQAYDTLIEQLYEDPEGVYGLDLGVAGVTIALSAGRCIPFSSCNAGAFGGHHHESHPVVAFYARPEMVDLLLVCAEEAGCGLENGDGYLIVYDQTIDGLISFGGAIIAHRKEFRTLRLRPYRSRKSARLPKTIQLEMF